MVYNEENKESTYVSNNSGYSGTVDEKDTEIDSVNYTIDITTVTRINSQCVLIMWKDVEGYSGEYVIKRSNGEGTYKTINSIEETYYYDWTAYDTDSYEYCIMTSDGGYKASEYEGFNEKNTTSVAVLMYHYFATDEDLENGCINNSGTISVEEIESDLKYFHDNNITTITCSDLVEYINGNLELPNQCVMITVDDGHYSIYKYLYPLLEEYDCKATISIIGSFADSGTTRTETPQSNYWMTWAEIGELAASGYFEIGSHSYDLHETNEETGRYGTRILDNESEEEYLKVLSEDNDLILSKLQNVGINDIVFFAFPYNDPCEAARRIYVSDLNYKFLLVGDDDYFYPTKSNYFVMGAGEENMDTHLIRRIARHTGDDISMLLEEIWAD